MRRLLYVFLLMAWATAQGQTIFPLKISENKRYFVNQHGKPYLYHADTGWEIFTKLTTKEAVEYMSFRKSQGFNTIQGIIGFHPGEVNRYGQQAFDNSVDFSQPNEVYHDHVAEIIDKADSLGLLIVWTKS